MDFHIKLIEVQSALMDEELDGWLMYDYRKSNPFAHTFLEIPPEKMTSRRFLYWIPKSGIPIKIVPCIEPYTLDHLPGMKWTYKGWQDFEQLIISLGLENNKIVMEYSPYNALPNISKVDAGTIEFLRKMGAQVLSSANILQRYTSVWTAEQAKSHADAGKILEVIADKTWAHIKKCLQQELPLDEYRVQQFILERMKEEHCTTSNPPTCAVNAHSADPHYYPVQETAFPIQRGDFILIDLWCKQKISHSVYADITQVGIAAIKPTQKQQEIFNHVKNARDQATQFVKNNYENKRSIEGWEVDQACRNFIVDSGYGEYFIHRTGHNLGEEVHGSGTNIDNFETHDDRLLLSGTGFTIEPGIYLPNQFGIRLEYNIYLNPSGKMQIFGGIQEEIVCFSKDH